MFLKKRKYKLSKIWTATLLLVTLFFSLIISSVSKAADDNFPLPESIVDSVPAAPTLPGSTGSSGSQGAHGSSGTSAQDTNPDALYSPESYVNGQDATSSNDGKSTASGQQGKNGKRR